MHGGLPPPDAFPFATLGGDLVPDPLEASPADAAQQAASAAQSSSQQLQRLDITDPQAVALAQQYIMTPRVSDPGWRAAAPTAISICGQPEAAYSASARSHWPA